MKILLKLVPEIKLSIFDLPSYTEHNLCLICPVSRCCHSVYCSRWRV